MKEMIIIAGPNGSGKSTLASQLALQCKFISADDCEKMFLSHIVDREERESRATFAVAKEIQAYIKAEKSFAFETVFSTVQVPEFIKQAKLKGYKINLHYIATENHDINVSRVAKRVNEGGHDVPKQRIIERYSKSLAILPELLRCVDEAILYDNSEMGLRPFLVKENNQIKITSPLPEWAKRVLSLF